jgi:phage/plasmid-associated DNA primase
MDAVSTFIRSVSDTTTTDGTSGSSFRNLSGIKTRFDVSNSKLGDFYAQYCRMAFDDEDADTTEGKPLYNLNIAELITGKTIPLIIPMLLRFHLREDDRNCPDLYADKFLLKVTSCCQQVQREKLEFTTGMPELLCVVEESKTWQQGNETCIMTKFQFPYCQINLKYYREKFIPAFINELRHSGVIQMLKIQPIGDWDSIIQPIGDAIPMYRSVSDPSRPRMTNTHIYGYITEDDIINEHTVEKELTSDIFQATSHSHIHRRVIANPSFLDQDVPSEFWLPLFLSIHFWYEEASPKINAVETILNIEGQSEITSDVPTDMIYFLEPMLGQHRYDHRIYWMDMGRAFAKIYGGSEQGCRHFEEFSRRCSDPNRVEECETIYTKFSEEKVPITIKTVAFYAREDSPHEYKEWHKAWCSKAFEDSLELSNATSAEVLYRVHWLDFMCGKDSGDDWYQFQNSRLVKLGGSIKIRNLVDKSIIPMYDLIQRDDSEKLIKTQNQSEKRIIDQHIEDIGKLKKKLNSHGFRSSTVSMARDKFHVENFHSYIDIINPDKMAWTNCVTEILDKQIFARPGKPEDYITLCTLIPHDTNFTWEHPKVKDCLKWLGQVFTDKDLLHYVLKDFSSYLKGRNSEKLFRIWAGMGNNSKSMIVKLILAVLGLYAIDFPVSLLSGKSLSSSGPTPELAQARGVHVGVICEPDDTEDLKGGAIKRFTGGDRFFARFLNDNGGSVEAFFKLIFMCNRIPNIPNADSAVMDRFLIIPYLSTWSDNAPDDEVEQYKTRTFKKDPFFERKIPDMAKAMGWIMVQYFPLYAEEGITPPQIVKEYTTRHWEEHDTYISYIHERITTAWKDPATQLVRDDNATLSASNLFGDFRRWFTSYYPGVQVPNQQRLRDELIMPKRLGPQNGKRQWLGIKIAAAAAPGAATEMTTIPAL